MSALLEEVREYRRLPSPEQRRAIRLKAHVSQEAIANALGVHRVSVARWEMGTRVPRRKVRLAYAKLLEELRRELEGEP